MAEAIDKIFDDLRTEKIKNNENKTNTGNSQFDHLPDGKYIGRVHIEPKTVASKDSPNLGLAQYEVQITVVEGKFAGKSAFRYHVIVPRNLQNPPTDDEKSPEYSKWKAAVILSLQKADELLESFGVNTNCPPEETKDRIAVYNRQNVIVEIKVKEGRPYLEKIISKPVEDQEGSLLAPTNLQSNEAPIA